MKKLILLLLFIPLFCYGQDTIPATKILTQKEAYMNKMLELKKEFQINPKYKLHPTQNMYNFLMLDTATGMIWQVQWSLNSNKRFTTILNAEILVNDGMYDENLPGGRFELYPTENMYNLLLLDTKAGRTWQVQWNFDEDKRFITRIY